VTIHWTNHQTGNGAALTGSVADGKQLLSAGVDAARAATQTAHGAVNIATARDLASAPSGSWVPRVSLAQVVDSAATEIKTLLGRMRQIATTGASDALSLEQRGLLQEEFSMLQTEIDSIALGSALGQEEDFEEEALSELGRMSTSALTVGPNKARVDSATESDWSVFHIDTATDVVEDLRDEYGTIEDRVDAALAELNTYVDSISADSCGIQTAAEAFDAAQRSRLLMMHKDGVESCINSTDLQQSVFALLQ
jgi:flagellin